MTDLKGKRRMKSDNIQVITPLSFYIGEDRHEMRIDILPPLNDNLRFSAILRSVTPFYVTPAMTKLVTEGKIELSALIEYLAYEHLVKVITTQPITNVTNGVKEALVSAGIQPHRNRQW